MPCYETKISSGEYASEATRGAGNWLPVLPINLAIRLLGHATRNYTTYIKHFPSSRTLKKTSHMNGVSAIFHLNQQVL